MALLSTPLPPRALASFRLSFAAATTLTVGAGILGAVLDVSRGAPAHTLLALLMSLGVAVAVLTVPREDMVRVVVMVPLAYLGLLVLGGIAAQDGGYRVWLVTAFVAKAPVVLFATGAAVVFGGLRHALR